MDSFSSQKTKPRKTKKLAKKSRVQIILDLFYRAIEIVLVLVTVATLCYHLVITLHDSGVAAVIIANRNLAFVVANAIVIALIVKSGLLLNQEVGPKTKRNALYEEFVQESSRRDEARAKQSEAEKETLSITETIAKQRDSVKREKQSIVEHQEKKMEKQKRQIQSYQRSRSENLEGLEKSSCGRLRRSETDASSERFDSDDELRYKIESFIARQRRNQIDD